MASPRIIVSTLLLSATCLGLGFYAGRFTAPSKQTVTDTVDTVSLAQPWSGSGLNSKSTRALPESETTIPGEGSDNTRDVDDFGNDEVATIPISALELLSSATVHVPGENLFDRDDAVIDALAIDDMEKAKLQTAYKEVGDRLKSEEASATEVMKNEDGTFSLSVPSMVQARNRAREKFSVDVLSSLGEDRGKVFLAAKQHSSMFGKEGAPKDYLVEMESVGDGNYRYRVSEMEGEERRVFVGNAIPTRLRHLSDVAKIVPVLESTDEQDEE